MTGKLKIVDKGNALLVGKDNTFQLIIVANNKGTYDVELRLETMTIPAGEHMIGVAVNPNNHFAVAWDMSERGFVVKTEVEFIPGSKSIYYIAYPVAETVFPIPGKRILERAENEGRKADELKERIATGWTPNYNLDLVKGAHLYDTKTEKWFITYYNVAIRTPGTIEANGIRLYLVGRRRFKDKKTLKRAVEDIIHTYETHFRKITMEEAITIIDAVKNFLHKTSTGVPNARVFKKIDDDIMLIVRGSGGDFVIYINPVISVSKTTKYAVHIPSILPLKEIAKDSTADNPAVKLLLSLGEGFFILKKNELEVVYAGLLGVSIDEARAELESDTKEYFKNNKVALKLLKAVAKKR